MIVNRVVKTPAIDVGSVAAASAATTRPASAARVKYVVLVCHLGRAGYNLQRALQAIGVRTYLVYDNRATSMRWSRGCTPLYRADDLSVADAAVIVDKINEVHRTSAISCVIPTDVQASRLLARMGSRLIPPIFPIPDPDTLRQLDDKWEFARICMAHGVPIPATLHFATNQALDLKRIDRELGYPVIVKPTIGFGQRNIVVLHSVEEAASFQASASHQRGMVVQEFIDGRDWSLSVFARDGVVTHWTAWECPAQLSNSYGVARFMTTSFRYHDGLIEMGRLIVAATRFTGVANFDARLDRDGRMVFFECNPRFFNRMLAARMCGLNFVAAGLPDHAMKQQTSLTEGDYYPWQELFTLRGLKFLVSGQWKIRHLFQDVAEMLRDPLPPLLRKLTGEDGMDRL